VQQQFVLDSEHSKNLLQAIPFRKSMLAFAVYTCAFSTNQPLTSQPLKSIPAYCEYGSYWILKKCEERGWWNGCDGSSLHYERSWLCDSVCEIQKCQYGVVDMYMESHNVILEMFLKDHPNTTTHAADLCPECCYPECIFPQCCYPERSST
jgi:hypothetical protein